jgi:hypothetical protein
VEEFLNLLNDNMSILASIVGAISIIFLKVRNVIGSSFGKAMKQLEQLPELIYNEPKNQDNFQRGFKVIS